MERRDFLTLLAGGVATSVFVTLANHNVPAQHRLPAASELLQAGPMLGRSEMTETEIWLQTKRPCQVAVRFWKQGKPETARLAGPVKTADEADLIARFTLDRLEYGTLYDYEVYLDGRRVQLGYQTTFQTQKMWQWRVKESDEMPPFKIAFGSCAYINDEPFDRPGNPYGGGYEIFRSIAEQRPDAMVWLGDNIYYREADWLSETAMRYRYSHGRSLPQMQQLLANTHHYAIWDDHDFGPDDSDKAFRLRERSLEIFKDYWANASYGTSETPGVFGRFEWNDVEFFMLDNRYYRSANRMPDIAARRMFGDAQMEWLENALSSSTASFKIIAGGNQMMNPITPVEAFGNFPTEQKRLIDFIKRAKISGVVFISGDRHFAELIKRKEEGLYPLYDFTSSPLTSGPAMPKAAEADNPSRIKGTLVTGKRNFGMLQVTGTAKERTLLMKCFDTAGIELWRHEIKLSELTFSS